MNSNTQKCRLPFLQKKLLLSQIICIFFGISAMVGQNQNIYHDAQGLQSLSEGIENSIPALTESIAASPCIDKTIPSQTAAAVSLTADGKDFYVGSFSSQILKISGADGSLLKTLNIGFTRPYGMTFIDGYLWVTNNDGGIHKMDTATGVSVKIIPTPFNNDETGLTWDGTHLWHISRSNSTLSKMDTTTGAVLASFSISSINNPSGLSLHGPYFWIGSNVPFHEIYRMDTATMTITDTIDSPGTYPNGQAPMGQYLWTIINGTPNNAIDSVYRIDISCTLCAAPVTSAISATACDSYISPGGFIYTSTGIYHDTLATSSLGCDSIITINLTIDNSTTSSLLVDACESYTSPNGTILTSTGIYQDTLANSLGCDSVIVIDLVINTPTSGIVDVLSCGEFLSPDSNEVWTTSGVYMDTISNVNGCDSLMTVNLTIDTVETGVTQTNATLTADAVNNTYQWLDCDNGFALIPNETNQTFAPAINGNYAVEITNANGCADTSECIAISTVGITENSLGTGLQIFPNPTLGHFQLAFDRPISAAQVSIYTVKGVLIHQSNISNQQIDLEIDGPAGLYFVEVINRYGRATMKVMKR